MGDKVIKILLGLTILLAAIVLFCIYSVYVGQKSSGQVNVVGHVLENSAGAKEDLTNFVLSREKINLVIKPGQKVVENIDVKNLKDTQIIIKNSINGKLFENTGIRIVPDKLVIKQGSSEKLSLEFNVGESVKPGIYIGNVILSDGWTTQEISVSVSVVSSEEGLKNNLKLRPDFLEVSSGENIFADVEISSLDGVSVKNEYFIVGADGEDEMKISSEEIVMNGEQSFSKRLELPVNLKNGKYLLYLKSISLGMAAVSSSEFSVKNNDFEIDSEKVLNWSFIGLIALTIISVSYMGLRLFMFFKKAKRVN